MSGTADDGDTMTKRLSIRQCIAYAKQSAAAMNDGRPNFSADFCRDTAFFLETLTAERDRLREALRTVLDILDDPTGGAHVQDMRRAQEVARAALAEKEPRDE